MRPCTCNIKGNRYIILSLTGHAEVVWVSDEQRITNAIVGLVITARPDTAEMILALFLATSSYTNVWRDTRTRARAGVGLARPSSKRVSDRTFRAFASGSLWRHDALRVITANVSVTCCVNKEND